MKAYYVKQTKRGEEKMIRAFSSYEKAQAYLQEYAENMGYEVKSNEDGIVTGAIFDNKKRNVLLILTIEPLEIY